MKRQPPEIRKPFRSQNCYQDLREVGGEAQRNYDNDRNCWYSSIPCLIGWEIPTWFDVSWCMRCLFFHISSLISLLAIGYRYLHHKPWHFRCFDPKNWGPRLNPFTVPAVPPARCRSPMWCWRSCCWDPSICMETQGTVLKWGYPKIIQNWEYVPYKFWKPLVNHPIFKYIQRILDINIP